MPTVLGLEAGIYIWALAAGAGLAAVVAASEVAYTVLRVAGAIETAMRAAGSRRGSAASTDSDTPGAAAPAVTATATRKDRTPRR